MLQKSEKRLYQEFSTTEKFLMKAAAYRSVLGVKEYPPKGVKLHQVFYSPTAFNTERSLNKAIAWAIHEDFMETYNSRPEEEDGIRVYSLGTINKHSLTFYYTHDRRYG